MSRPVANAAMFWSSNLLALGVRWRVGDDDYSLEKGEPSPKCDPMRIIGAGAGHVALLKTNEAGVMMGIRRRMTRLRIKKDWSMTALYV